MTTHPTEPIQPLGTTLAQTLRRVAEKYQIAIAIYYGDNKRATQLITRYVDGVLNDMADAR